MVLEKKVWSKTIDHVHLFIYMDLTAHFKPFECKVWVLFGQILAICFECILTVNQFPKKMEAVFLLSDTEA